MNMAYCDCIVDALTVLASKSEVEEAGKNLNSVCYLFQGIGAIAGASLSMAFSKEGEDVDYFTCFGIYAAL